MGQEKPKIEVLFPTEQVAGRVLIMANEISRIVPKDPLIVAILRGSFVFAADLIRALHATGASPQVDFLTLASYGKDTESSGVVDIVRDMTQSPEGRDVLIIDDILETGHTLSFARELMTERKAKSVKIAVLLEKPGKLKTTAKADFVGFSVPDKFVVGYGLDYANYYRELPYIGVIKN
jgi:hypoxanthine phosphoribosyltransferase